MDNQFENDGVDVEIDLSQPRPLLESDFEERL